MKNNIFDIKFNDKAGFIDSISLNADKYKMNFVKDGASFGDLIINFIDDRDWTWKPTLFGFNLVDFTENESSATAKLEFKGFTLVVKYAFDGDRFKVDYKLTNTNPYPYYFMKGDLKVRTVFNDCLIGSENCLKKACHQHLWHGLQSSYIFAERMLTSNDSLGVFFHNGSYDGYTQLLENEAGKDGSRRGELLMNLQPVTLLCGDSIEFGYTIFDACSKEDFFDKVKTFDNYLHVDADGFTVEQNTPIKFTVTAKNDIKHATCTVDGESVDFTIDGNVLSVEFTPKTTGDKKVLFTVDGVSSYALFNVVLPIDELIKRRVHFIVDNQQCLDKRSPLYGAYLLYDNKENRQYFNFAFSDHNAGKERFGIPSVIAKWLQNNNDEKVKKSFDLYVEYFLRECVDKDTGEVFNNILRTQDIQRLYNIPWVMNLVDELFKLTGDEFWVDLLIKIIRFYYTFKGGTGDRFYPDGCMFYNSLKTIIDAGKREQAKDVFERFDRHIKNIIDIGISYPNHEVCYEQTIVSPACTFLLDKYALTGDEYYLAEAKKHLKILRRFEGEQPDYHLNKVAIRFWDDFWFGKAHIYADSMPHYWAVYSAVAFAYYGSLAGDKKAIRYGVESAKNHLCLFDEEGRGYCNYIYPDFINDREGKFFDDWSNDQDLGLYMIMQTLDFDK